MDAQGQQQQSNQSSFDIIIVGCGPSAIGILYGLLKKHKNTIKNYTIAVIEQGKSLHSDTKPYSSTSSTSTLTTNNTTTYSTNPQEWYKASHFNNSNNNKHITSVQNITIPQHNLNNRILEIPMGIGYGGGTNINACLFIQPMQDDFKSWPGIWKNGMHILNALKDIKHNMIINKGLCTFETDESYFQKTCNNNTATTTSSSPIVPCRKHDFVLDDSIVSNISFITKFHMTMNNKNLQRVNYFDSLIKPFLSSTLSVRSNNIKIDFFSNIQVQRLLLSNSSSSSSSDKKKVVIGIECYNNTTKQYYIIKAKLKVILCTGTIITPALLMASGIGNKETLKKANISLIQSIPSVGKSLHDHILLPRIFLSKTSLLSKNKSWNNIQAWYNTKIKKTFHNNKHNDENESSSSSSIYQFQFTDGTISSIYMISHFFSSVIFLRYYHSFFLQKIECGAQYLLLQLFYITRWIFFYILFYIPPFYYIIMNHIVTLNICLMNPKSNGCISVLKKNNNKEQNNNYYNDNNITRLNDLKILIDPGYLSSNDDVQSLKNGYKIGTILSNHHLKSCIEILPNKIIGHNTKLQRILFSEFILSYYHYCGTCSMSTTNATASTEGVVNDKLQVHNIQNLYICDASVFPNCISVPIASTCVAMGLVFSDILIKDIKNRKV